MFGGMNSSSNERNWREDETLEAAARRLWRDWDERIARKKAAEGLDNSSAEIGSPTAVPACRENDGQNPSDLQGFCALKDSGRHTAARAWEDSSGCGSWRGLCVCGVAMRPPAQPSAGSNSDGFTVEAEGIAQNVRSDEGD